MSPRGTILAFLIIVIAIAAGAALLLVTRPETIEITINPPQPTSTPEPTATPEPILVYVTGAVHEPETTVSLPYNSRVADAIEAAGGATDDADLSLVNLAAVLRDGDQVHVPPQSTAGEADSDASQVEALPTRPGGEIIAINSATAEELQTLPGIGPSTAAAIIEYREANGAFSSLEDLDNVPGIGPATLETLAPLLVFD
ncbi:MAG: ComEA family DNA-binding protein [Anaerolineae bacterium]|nr:ComEA family DNA-binding protein [Anaerolineae bacterium]